MLKNSAVQLISAYCVEQMNSIALGSLAWDEIWVPSKKAPQKGYKSNWKQQCWSVHLCGYICHILQKIGLFKESHGRETGRHMIPHKACESTLWGQ